MSQAVYLNRYKLKKGVLLEGFLSASEKLNTEEISKKQRYVSWTLMGNGDSWVDTVIFETMEGLERFEAEAQVSGERAKAFYSYINFMAKGGKHLKVGVERKYGRD